jgi:hypothetical protein
MEPMRVEAAELTFLNMPMKQPELWVWGLRDGCTIGLVELHTDIDNSGIGKATASRVLSPMRPASASRSTGPR